MKLATYHDGSRDGQLVVVSRDLRQAHFAQGIATRMQAVLDDWNFLSPQLEDLAAALEAGRARHAFAFDPRGCMAPLPRAHGWWAGGATGAALAAGGRLLGPHASLGARPRALWLQPVVLTADWQAEADDEGTGPAAQDAAAQALDAVRLVAMAIHCQLAQGSLSAFAPLAITPDELGAAWRSGRLGGRARVRLRGRALANDDGAETELGPALVQAAGAAGLAAGSLVGGRPWVGVPAWPDATPASTPQTSSEAAPGAGSAAGPDAASGSAGEAPAAAPTLLTGEFRLADGSEPFGRLALALPV